jgi:hypothetical protein
MTDLTVPIESTYQEHLADSRKALKRLIARRQQRFIADDSYQELSSHLGELVEGAVASDDRVAHYRSELEGAMEVAATKAIVEALPISPEEFLGLLNGTHEVRRKLDG